MHPENDDLPPEARNVEQDDEPGQAQQVASEAGLAHEPSPLDSDKVPGGFDEVNEPDLIDHMRDMEASGRIDMGAFAGEPNMDDEDEAYGPDNDPDLV